jgi:hypothetical protein
LTALSLIKAALSRCVVTATDYVVIAGQKQTVLAATTYIGYFFFKIFKSLYFGG